VNVRAIPELPSSTCRILSLAELPLVGAAEKNYVRFGNPETSGYIAKKGRFSGTAGYRECVTEEMISKIGALLPLRMAKSRIVRIGRNDVRFMSRNFVDRRSQELRHGVEIVAEYLDTETVEVERVFDLADPMAEHNFYTIDLMLEVLTWKCRDHAETVIQDFARMIAFDAFVGAPDRHAMNWGVLVPVGPSGDSTAVFAPIFDTARGLFREHSDDDLRKKSESIGRSTFIERYAERSKPVFGTGRPGGSENHFELIGWILENHPRQLGDRVQRFYRTISMRQIERMLRKRFRRIVTTYRIDFVKDLLTFRLERLRQICAKTETRT
jgi:hypothetical protein